LKLVQEWSENALELVGIGNDFLNKTQMAQQLKERIDKWNYMKFKTSAWQKKQSLNWRGCPQNGRKSLPAIHLTRD
jgi:hypothetical protein